MAFIVINGELIPAESATVSPDDRGLVLGDGLFETIAVRDGEPRHLDLHLARLERAREAFNLNRGIASDRIAELIEILLEKNELDDARVRVTLTRGRNRGSMSLYDAEPDTLITAIPLSPRREGGLALITAGIRFSPHNPIFFHKTLNRLPHLWARSEAERAGADEALILDETGNVACASTANLFAVSRGMLFTPPLTAPILPGITRGRTLRLAAEAELIVRESCFAPIMLAGADEVFLTNSIQGVMPVTSVDGRPVGSGQPGPAAARLRKLLEED